MGLVRRLDQAHSPYFCTCLIQHMWHLSGPVLVHCNLHCRHFLNCSCLFYTFCCFIMGRKHWKWSWRETILCLKLIHTIFLYIDRFSVYRSSDKKDFKISNSSLVDITWCQFRIKRKLGVWVKEQMLIQNVLCEFYALSFGWWLLKHTCKVKGQMKNNKIVMDMKTTLKLRWECPGWFSLGR